ncbi:hypothetical protein Baya_5245 [Bagarius yarrelli]|uniref:Uncharacterized protein n=1 Tax=Bagarius yarrelli TaxID=175774 RepID=A0A556TTZ8_BAGYA|nr:hypothetical protein Baya_5245 [Bagarius yarrelli]
MYTNVLALVGSSTQLPVTLALIRDPGPWTVDKIEILTPKKRSSLLHVRGQTLARLETSTRNNSLEPDSKYSGPPDLDPTQNGRNDASTKFGNVYWKGHRKTARPHLAPRPRTRTRAETVEELVPTLRRRGLRTPLRGRFRATFGPRCCSGSDRSSGTNNNVRFSRA